MSAETTAHFLVYCNLYTEVRNVMLQVINPILESNGLRLPNDDLFVKFLLYGQYTLSIEENKTMLNATLEYIHESTRFDIANE